MHEELKWFKCPICGQKLCKVLPEAHGVYLKCKKCKQEVEVRYSLEPKPEPVTLKYTG